MAYDYVFLDRALEELNDLSAFIAAHSESDRAIEGFFAGLERSIEFICENPYIHALSRFPELAARGYRAAIVGSYVLLYQFSDDTVYIAHIFHQRQDYAQLV